MSVKVMHWIVLRAWGNVRMGKFRYTEKDRAEALAAELNETTEFKHFVLSIKEPVTEQLCKIDKIDINRRRIQGITEDRRTGDKRRWSKILFEMEIVATAQETKHKTKDIFVVHHHRGDMKVVGFKTLEDFLKLTKQRWPEDLDEVSQALDQCYV